jgi:hypothetical protein
LRPDKQKQIISEPPLTVFDFTDAVLVGEGLDPAAHKALLNGVRIVVAAAFARSAQLTADKP